MNRTRHTVPTAGAWPWLMSEARSALPEAPVVAHVDVERPVAAGQRLAVARALRRFADRLEPRYGPAPFPDSASPC